MALILRPTRIRRTRPRGLELQEAVNSVRRDGRGVYRTGFGQLGAPSNDSQNMLEAIKAAALLQKVARLDPTA